MKQSNVTAPDGTRLCTVESGARDGLPILFIHGWSQSHLSWSRQMESSLADHFRVVAFDLRGHGASDKPTNGYAESTTWAQDVQAVIEALSLERPLLVGWSYGGLILNDYVRQQGEGGIAGLCYVGAATDLGVATSYPFLGSTWNGLMPQEPASVAGTVFTEDAEEIAKAMRLFVRGCFAEPPSPTDEAMMLGVNLECPSRVRAALFNRAVQNDDLLPNLSVPVLVIHGTADEVVRVETGRHIAQQVPHARIIELPGLGHAPFWEDSEAFNRELGTFANSLRK